ncbi:MAG: ABC transporter substrate-binding protein [Oscillospiraceae bacterium]
MKKKLLALALALVSALTLVACGEAPAPAAPDPTSLPMQVVTTSESYGPLFEKFTKDTGIQVEFLSLSSGEVLSKVKAEGGAPMADLWFGGGIDAFMQAKADGLLEPVTFDASASLADTFKDADGYWFSKGITVVGFLVNNDILKEQSLPMPATWDDLTNPVYQSEILMSNPAISGTNYAVVNALLQTKGEEAGWKYFEDLNKNIDYYAKRGKDPNVKCVAGEVAIGITYIDPSITKLEAEQNVTVVYPTDGLPYVPEGVAAFHGSPNTAAAKQFIEWLYSDDANLQLLAGIDEKDSIKLIKPDMAGIELSFDASQLMTEDLSLFGANRTAILDRWATLMGDKAEPAGE